MPYINLESRTIFDTEINKLIELLRDSDKIDGNINYCITRIVSGALQPDNGWNYTIASDAIKAFECAKLEFYERILRKVEDNAISRNGDINEYR